MSKKFVITMFVVVLVFCAATLLFKDYVYDFISRPTYIVYAKQNIKAGQPIMIKDLKYKEVDVKDITSDYKEETDFQKVLIVKGKKEKSIAETIVISLSKIKILNKFINK